MPLSRRVVAAIVIAAALGIAIMPRDYVVCPDWDIFVVDQDGKPLPGIAMHVFASHPAVDGQDLSMAMTTDAQGRVFVPRRVVRAARWRAIAGTLKQARALVHAEFRSSGYAAISPQAGYGYPNPGEAGEQGAYWYSETGHVVSHAVLYRCVPEVRRYGC